MRRQLALSIVTNPKGDTMSDAKLVVYSVSPMLAYIGEIVSDSPEEIVLTKTLVLERHLNKQTGSVESSIGPVHYASRDSKVTIAKKAAPGIVVDNPDSHLLDAYKREVLQSYSSLSLV